VTLWCTRWELSTCAPEGHLQRQLTYIQGDDTRRCINTIWPPGDEDEDEDEDDWKRLNLRKAAKFAYQMSESNWETLSQRRKISRICALFKAYSREPAWKVIGDRLQRPNYLSRIDHDWKNRNRRLRTDIRKYSFVNRTTRLWNRLPAEILGTLLCKQSAFRKRVRRVINVVNWRKSEWVVNCLKSAVNYSEVKCSAVKELSRVVPWRVFIVGEVKWSEVKCSEVKWKSC
jgi:hypothetical protein